ncbi:hypothetical protein [Nonomuraea phyllanthi]|nr:hypothetical protein [Nonomuraea phyllanthi]
MICESCKDKRHEDCRGGSWCDCQHHEEEERPEPELSWRRQG